MPIFHQQGELPRKRHVAFRDAKGQLRHEELIGSFGFSGPSSLLYHLRPPTSLRAVEPLRDLTPREESEPLLCMRHLRTSALPAVDSASLDRQALLFNSDCQISAVRARTRDAHFYRNGEADEYIFVAEGQGRLESPFGYLPFAAGDQIVIPRGVLYRLQHDTEISLLVVESRGHLRWPERYLTRQGQLKEGAPFCERDIRRPKNMPTHDESGDHEIIVKQRGQLTRVILDHHPCDLVGWDGYYYPWAFGIHDFEPITGAIHQPPPVHQFLEADALVLCNFVPRPYDFFPDAIPAPYNHSNVMTDEVLFYASSEFMSRKGIGFGSLTLHPDGLPHGPHPGRYQDSIGKARTDELAVMIDTFKPLRVAQSAVSIEDRDYFKSWIPS